jgi:hypothetical protein
LRKHCYIGVDGNRAIRMNESTCPGAYLLNTTHGEGFSAPQNHAHLLTAPRQTRPRAIPRQRAPQQAPVLEVPRRRSPSPPRIHSKHTFDQKERKLYPSGIMFADKHGRKLVTFTYPERRVVSLKRYSTPGWKARRSRENSSWPKQTPPALIFYPFKQSTIRDIFDRDTDTAFLKCDCDHVALNSRQLCLYLKLCQNSSTDSHS